MTDPVAPAVVIHRGDCVEVMRAMPECSVDAIVTDPPYGIGFMGMTWLVKLVTPTGGTVMDSEVLELKTGREGPE